METTAKENENTTKAKILAYLKEYGEASVELLSGFLKITQMAVRKHLNSLSIQGVIATRKLNKRIGRPSILYMLKVNNDEPLALELLNVVNEAYGNSAVINIISKRNQRFYEKYKLRFLNKMLPERISETVKVFNENGYDTEIIEDKNNKKITLKHNLCPNLKVAEQHQAFCAFETEVLETFLDTKVNRVCHFCSGDKYCAYEILC